MARVLFVDDRLDEVINQWERSGCARIHELLDLEPFVSIERTRAMVEILKPDVIVIGYGLSTPPITGADIIRRLRVSGYTGRFIANSGGGVDQFHADKVQVDGSADRRPSRLWEALGKTRGGKP